MVGKNHGIQLDRVDDVCVVTDNSSQASLSQFRELFVSEGVRKSSKFIPESVTTSGITELGGNDAGEGRTNHGTWKRSLRDTAGPQVNILRVNVDLGVTFNSNVIH